MFGPQHALQLFDNARRYAARCVFVLAGRRFGESAKMRARFNDAVFYSQTRGFVFPSNEKAGNTTLRKTLQQLEGGGKTPPFYRPLKRWTGPLLQPSDVADFSDVLRDRSVYKFCVVRNPLARLVSCYRDKFETASRGPSYNKKLRELKLDSRRNEAPFAEFVDAIARQDQADMNPHWRPQYYNTFMDLIEYDEIIRFEDFPEKLVGLVRRFYPEANQESVVKSGNRKAVISEALVDQYFRPSLKRKAREIYAIDFDRFGFGA